jgi:hypothetical protein
MDVLFKLKRKLYCTNIKSVLFCGTGYSGVKCQHKNKFSVTQKETFCQFLLDLLEEENESQQIA